jgi:hypothetical protein
MDMVCVLQGGSNMTGTNCDLFTHKQSRSYLNRLVQTAWLNKHKIYLVVTSPEDGVEQAAKHVVVRSVIVLLTYQ